MTMQDDFRGALLVPPTRRLCSTMYDDYKTTLLDDDIYSSPLQDKPPIHCLCTPIHCIYAPPPATPLLPPAAPLPRTTPLPRDPQPTISPPPPPPWLAGDTFCPLCETPFSEKNSALFSRISCCLALSSWYHHKAFLWFFGTALQPHSSSIWKSWREGGIQFDR